MEPEMNNENWSQPYEDQTQPENNIQPQQENTPFFQSPWLQKTWLNVKLATWVKCLIIIAALSIAAALIAPKFTSAQSEQDTNFSASYPDFEDDWYGYED